MGEGRYLRANPSHHIRETIGRHDDRVTRAESIRHAGLYTNTNNSRTLNTKALRHLLSKQRIQMAPIISFLAMPFDQFAAFIHKLCQMDRFGGRCIRINESTWEVLDIEQWSEHHQASLQSRFPRITAKVTTNRKSLSGFSVLLHLQKAPHMWTSMLICAVMMTAMITITRSFRI